MSFWKNVPDPPTTSCGERPHLTILVGEVFAAQRAYGRKFLRSVHEANAKPSALTSEYRTVAYIGR